MTQEGNLISMDCNRGTLGLNLDMAAYFHRAVSLSIADSNSLRVVVGDFCFV